LQNLKLTNKGKTLLSKIVNQPLTLTHMSLGKGSASQFNPGITQPVSEVLKKEIEYCFQEDDGIYVRTTFSNQEVVTGFYVSEIGIYAMDPDEGEILYAYTNAYGESTDYFNSGTSIPVKEIVEVKIVFANASDIQLIIDPSKVFVTVEDMNNAIGEKADRSELPTKLPADGGNADTVNNFHIVKKTQAEYDALGTKDANTLYVIVG
jgi:phage-related tail fiber protein